MQQRENSSALANELCVFNIKLLTYSIVKRI